MILFEILYTNFWSSVCNSRIVRDDHFLETSRPDVFVAPAVSARAVTDGNLVQDELGMVGRIKDPFDLCGRG